MNGTDQEAKIEDRRSRNDVKNTAIRRFASWQVARELVNTVYDLTEKGEFARDFALRDQIRRAVISILSNIAERFESASDINFIRYLGYSKSSTAEVRSQLYISLDRKYISQDEFHLALNRAYSCGKQLTGFIQYLQSNPQPHRMREESPEYELPPEP